MYLRFYRCEICGKILTVLSGDSVPTVCCGEVMKEIIPNHVDAAAEKHVPVFQTEGNRVRVQIGSVPHPMTEKHFIVWIGLRSTHGFAFRQLHPEDPPETCFECSPTDRAEAVYAFCNLHGLWCSEEESVILPG